MLAPARGMPSSRARRERAKGTEAPPFPTLHYRLVAQLGSFHTRARAQRVGKEACPATPSVCGQRVSIQTGGMFGEGCPLTSQLLVSIWKECEPQPPAFGSGEASAPSFFPSLTHTGPITMEGIY